MCIVACKDWNGVLPGPAKFREMYDVEVGEYPTRENNWNNGEEFQVYLATYSCMHCDNPACIDACGFRAIYKRQSDGVVIVDRDKCRGLGTCITACLYKALRLPDNIQETPALPLTTATKGHTPVKCGFCLDRIYDTEGLTLNDSRTPEILANASISPATRHAPACVGACRMRALDFGDIEELKRKYPDAVNIADAEVPGFPHDDSIGNDGRRLRTRTGPNMLVKMRKK